jgi:hypothetical protein
MPRAFTRQLGSQPGVQLNPIRDRTNSGTLGIFDQTAAIVGRFVRGRIDKPFRVNRSTIRQLLGKPASVSLSLLNEAYVHVYEALQRGAREVIVSRLSVPGAVVSWANFTSAAASTFAVSATAPTVGTLGVKFLGCNNDGIVVRVHADVKLVSGTPVANDMVTVQIVDADGIILFTITGSLTSGSVNEFGESNFLPDVSAGLTDLLEWTIIGGATIATTHDGYGKNAAGADKYATSTLLSAFTEGGTGFVSADYDRAITALMNAQEDFGYIMGGGTRAVSLITKLADLAYETNRQFVFDVPGDLTVDGAIAFVQSLGFGTLGRDQYPQAYWAPLKSLDPINGNVVIFGTSGAQVGYRCARNAQTNSYGLAPKNSPIAGLNGNLGRPRVTQVLALSEQNLSDLADAKINPVIFQTFSSGSVYAFSDSLTCANTRLSYRKLVSVAEMSSDLDERVARFGRECLQLPMEQAIQRMKDYLEKLFGYALASGWLVDSGDPEIPPYAYEVIRNAVSPADRMDVQYWLHYDGVNRQVFVQQTIV